MKRLAIILGLLLVFTSLSVVSEASADRGLYQSSIYQSMRQGRRP